MARAHGRFSRLYIATASGGSASPLQHAGTWALSFTTDTVEVTAFGDTNKTYVAGLPDGNLSYSGFADDTAGTQLLTAATDGIARKVYAYPFASNSIYVAGTFFLDTDVNTDVSGAVTISGSGRPATPLILVGF
jgi:hypothetical protein